MGASCFVGRVGGLAVALGVGLAVFAAPGVAFATGDDDPAGPGRTAASVAAESAPAPSTAGQRGGRASASARADGGRGSAGGGAANVPDSAAVSRVRLAPAASAEAPARASAAMPAVIAATSPGAAVAPIAAVDNTLPVALDSPSDPVVESGLPESAPAEPDSLDAVAYATAETSDSAGDGPLTPLGEELGWAMLAVARRDTDAAVTLSAPAALVTNGEQSNNGVTADPTAFFDNGIVFGSLNATSERGNPLTYTVLGGSNGGKLTFGTVPTLPVDGQSYTILPYATWLNGGPKGSETFTVRITETTAVTSFLTGIPLLGSVFSPIISLLQQTPLISSLLAPVIGGSLSATIDVNVGALAPGDTPLAFTVKVASFDGVLISSEFFPASGLAAGETAPTVLNGPGLGSAGATNPFSTVGTSGLVPGLKLLRDAGYNAITWDPRGEFASGGILQLDNPFYEGRDVSALIDWAADFTPTLLDGPDDPRVGMVGGSYGGGIQMTTVDPRIEAIVPGIAWNSLNESLYPSDIFKTAWGNVLALSLLTGGARINSQIYEGIVTGNLFGLLSESAQAVLGSSGPTALLSNLQAPTLFLQGTVDALFPLVQAVQNAEAILANPFGTPVKMTWFCGGHGVCLDPVDQTAQSTKLFTDTIVWLNAYVAQNGTPPSLVPNFQWWDQAGERWVSDLFPFDEAFNQPVGLTATGDGGFLGILPFGIGGSGPNSQACTVAAACSFPLNQVFATEANNAINVAITPAPGDQIVGAPTVSFTYSGIGTARAVYAQIVDNVSGRVLGNIITPVPVTLDGQTRTVSVPIADIAYTAGANPSLTLQITSGASLYLNSAIGVIDISDVSVDLPLRAGLLV